MPHYGDKIFYLRHFIFNPRDKSIFPSLVSTEAKETEHFFLSCRTLEYQADRRMEITSFRRLMEFFFAECFNLQKRLYVAGV